MDSVITHFQARQASGFALLELQPDKVVCGVFADAAQVIKLGIIAGFDDATVTDNNRWIIDDRPCQLVCQGRERLAGGVQLLQQVGAEIRQHGCQVWQDLQSIAQARQVSWPGRAQSNPGENPLHVTNGLQELLQAFIPITRHHELDAVEALVE